jgi:hypothetical protein
MNLTKMEGAIIMIVLNVTAAIIALFGGIILDNFYSWIRDSGMYEAIPVAWQGTDTMLSVVNLFYFSCVVVAGAGWLIFILSLLQREGIDTATMRYYQG